MSVYKPKKSPYFHFDFQQSGRRFHGSTGCDTRRAAEGVERTKRRLAAEGRLGSEVPTLDEAAGRWWAERGKGLDSAKDVERRLEVMIGIIGAQVLISEITTATVSRAIEKRRGMFYQKSKRKGARRYLPSNTTVNRDIIDTLRPILRRAKRRWEIAGLPDIDWGELRLDEPKPKPKDLSAAELALILGAVRPHWHDFIRFSNKYGCRLGEMFFGLAALDLDDRSDARVSLRDRKGDDDHVIPVESADAAMLAARAGRARAAKLDTVWFRELRSGKLVALRYGGAEKAIMRAMTRTGLRAAKGMRGPHDLRRNSAMKLLRATGNLRLVQKLLGHASIQSTLVYAHAVEADLRAGLAALSRNSPEPLSEAGENAASDQDLKQA